MLTSAPNTASTDNNHAQKLLIDKEWQLCLLCCCNTHDTSLLTSQLYNLSLLVELYIKRQKPTLCRQQAFDRFREQIKPLLSARQAISIDAIEALRQPLTAM